MSYEAIIKMKTRAVNRVLFTLLFAFSANASALLLTLNATNSGWYNTELDSNGSASNMSI